MTYQDLLKTIENKEGAVSVLGLAEVDSSIQILRAMTSKEIKDRAFDIDIEPNLEGKNYVPKAKDICNETFNRFKIKSEFNITNESKYKIKSAVVVINSFTRTNILLPEVYSKLQMGGIIVLPLYKTNESVVEVVHNFLDKEKIHQSFFNSINFPYIIKNKVPFKQLGTKGIQRTRSVLT